MYLASSLVRIAGFGVKDLRVSLEFGVYRPVPGVRADCFGFLRGHYSLTVAASSASWTTSSSAFWCLKVLLVKGILTPGLLAANPHWLVLESGYERAAQQTYCVHTDAVLLAVSYIPTAI